MGLSCGLFVYFVKAELFRAVFRLGLNDDGFRVWTNRDICIPSIIPEGVSVPWRGRTLQ